LGGQTRDRLDDGVCRSPLRGYQRASPCVTSGRAGFTAHGHHGCVGLVCSGGAVQPWCTTTDEKPGCVGEDGAARHHSLNFARLHIHIRGGSLRTLQCTVGVLAFNVLHVSSGRAQGSGAYLTSSFHSHSDEPLQLFDGPRIVPSSACGRPR
jgi:hypothetical protein